MKNFKKIIGLFTVIFLAGVLLTIGTVKSTLKKDSPKQEIVEIKKDTTYLLTSEKEKA
tara:strand:+ start:345835 stop:346008 length:174 start_codon:yes stop_codon:yes gene_type:complete